MGLQRVGHSWATKHRHKTCVTNCIQPLKRKSLNMHFFKSSFKVFKYTQELVLFSRQEFYYGTTTECLQNFCFLKDIFKKTKSQSQSGRKYLWLVPKKRTSNHNIPNLIRKQTTPCNTGQQEIHEWPTGTWTDDQKKPIQIERKMFVFIYLFLITPLGLWDLSSPTRDWTCALSCESRVLTTGPPGVSPILK